MWLGVQAVWARVPAARPGGTHGATSAPAIDSRRGRPSGRASLSNLGNPKMAVFFTSLLPQFAPAGDASFSALLLLGLALLRDDARVAGGLRGGRRAAGVLLGRPGVRRVLEGVTGAALVTLGLHLALGRR